MARRVKLQSLTGAQIQVFEVEVYSSGDNVAAGKSTTQSTTFNNSNRFAAGLAVDTSNTTFSHTNLKDQAPWWMVDLRGMFSIESIVIVNWWCRNSSDPVGCLCRLSHASVAFFDDQNKWVHAFFIGDMCGVQVYENNLEKTTDYCTAH
jgi:hypothetical protein